MGVERYAFMWTDEVQDWVLLALEEDLDSALPYNLKSKLISVIEDNDMASAVVQRMRDAGVSVVTELPND
jgi:hypothetical protein